MCVVCFAAPRADGVGKQRHERAKALLYQRAGHEIKRKHLGENKHTHLRRPHFVFVKLYAMGLSWGNNHIEIIKGKQTDRQGSYMTPIGFSGIYVQQLPSGSYLNYQL